MFAMVTPPVLFFAHALSNYSEVFNKINTFFQKNKGFFRVFSYTCGGFARQIPYMGIACEEMTPIIGRANAGEERK